MNLVSLRADSLGGAKQLLSSIWNFRETICHNRHRAEKIKLNKRPILEQACQDAELLRISQCFERNYHSQLDLEVDPKYHTRMHSGVQNLSLGGRPSV
jgi:hypothetical protein